MYFLRYAECGRTKILLKLRCPADRDGAADYNTRPRCVCEHRQPGRAGEAAKKEAVAWTGDCACDYYWRLWRSYDDWKKCFGGSLCANTGGAAATAQAFIDDSTMRPLTREQVIAMLGEPAQSDGERLLYPFEGSEEYIIYSFNGSDDYDFLRIVTFPSDWRYEVEYYQNLPCLFGMETTGWDLDASDDVVYGSYDLNGQCELDFSASFDDDHKTLLTFALFYEMD